MCIPLKLPDVRIRWSEDHWQEERNIWIVTIKLATISDFKLRRPSKLKRATKKSQLALFHDEIITLLTKCSISCNRRPSHTCSHVRKFRILMWHRAAQEVPFLRLMTLIGERKISNMAFLTKWNHREIIRRYCWWTEVDWKVSLTDDTTMTTKCF